MTLAPDAVDRLGRAQDASGARERLGRYVLFPPFARGGMATVHLGLNVGPAGFRRIFAVKKLLPALTEDPQVARALVLEAKLSSFVRSPYVTSTLEVATEGEVFGLVMELVDGVTLARLLSCAHAEGIELPLPVASRILGDVLRGLQAVHEAADETGRPLGMIHRDVAPKNVLVGRDGLARIVDFGLAKVVGEKGLTRTGEIKGTLAYMAPEQTEPGRTVTRRTDLYAAGLIAWEMLTGAKYFADPHGAVGADRARAHAPEPPSLRRPEVPPALDQLLLRALSTDPAQRPATAEAMLVELESILAPATVEDVARFVEKVAWDPLEAMTERIRAALAAPLPEVTTGAADEKDTPTRPQRATERARLRRSSVAVAFFATAIALGFLLAFAARETTAPSPPSVASLEPAKPITSSRPPDVTPELQSPISSASAVPTSEKPAPSPVRRPRKERRSEPSRATLCNPPYEYDSEMRKRFKPECVE